MIEAASIAPEVAKGCHPGGKECDPRDKDSTRRGWDGTRSGKGCTRRGLAVQSGRQRMDSKRLRPYPKRQRLHPKSVIFDKKQCCKGSVPLCSSSELGRPSQISQPWSRKTWISPEMTPFSCPKQAVILERLGFSRKPEELMVLALSILPKRCRRGFHPLSPSLKT